MYKTYGIMSNCATRYYLDKELEELVEDYKATNEPRKRNKIVAAMFCKVFPMILKIQSRYYSLTNEQKVDHAIYHLLRSIYYYKNDGKVKFSSFFHTHLTNQMKTLLTTQNNLKNAVWSYIVKDSENVLEWYSSTTPDKELELTESYFLDNLKNSTYLSSEEKDFCACGIAGYTKMNSISEKMNTTDPLKIERYNNSQKDLKKLRRIKKSIYEKYKKYGMKIFG